MKCLDVVVVALLTVACGQPPEEVRPAPAAPAASPAAGATAAPPAKPNGITSRSTNWPEVVADVVEFRRNGRVLTAVVRLRNDGADTQIVAPQVASAYVIDELGGKKYPVLTDENGAAIADGGRTTGLAPAEAMTVWMKFPSPPPDTERLSLAIPGILPFEGLGLQAP